MHIWGRTLTFNLNGVQLGSEMVLAFNLHKFWFWFNVVRYADLSALFCIFEEKKEERESIFQAFTNKSYTNNNGVQYTGTMERTNYDKIFHRSGSCDTSSWAHNDDVDQKCILWCIFVECMRLQLNTSTV